MSAIYGFHHVCFINNGKQIFEDQYKYLVESGLYDSSEKIFCTVLGDYDDYIFPEKYEIILRSKDVTIEEGYILKYMFTNSHLLHGKYWYIHTKGVNHFNRYTQEAVHHWRKYMEYFVIDKWEQCVIDLDNYNTVGTSLLEGPTVATHFSGNFWWARSDYVQTNSPDFSIGRMAHESWICKASTRDKIKNYHLPNKDLYQNIIYPHEYK